MVGKGRQLCLRFMHRSCPDVLNTGDPKIQAVPAGQTSVEFTCEPQRWAPQEPVAACEGLGRQLGMRTALERLNVQSRALLTKRELSPHLSPYLVAPFYREKKKSPRKLSNLPQAGQKCQHSNPEQPTPEANSAPTLLAGAGSVRRFTEGKA